MVINSPPWKEGCGGNFLWHFISDQRNIYIPVLLYFLSHWSSLPTLWCIPFQILYSFKVLPSLPLLGDIAYLAFCFKFNNSFQIKEIILHYLKINTTSIVSILQNKTELSSQIFVYRVKQIGHKYKTNTQQNYLILLLLLQVIT